MSDLKSPFLIHLKGWLFFLILVVASVMLIVEMPHWREVVLLLLVIWASARFYYYLFYVIENYIDSEFKFAGIGSALRYLILRRKEKKTP